MTKEAYFDMCRQLGSEPLEEEIPLDMSDFPELVQSCFILYRYLQDNWDSMGGNYLGKNYSIVFELFNSYGITLSEERLLCLEILYLVDAARMKVINEKIKAKNPATRKK